MIGHSAFTCSTVCRNVGLSDQKLIEEVHEKWHSRGSVFCQLGALGLRYN